MLGGRPAWMGKPYSMDLRERVVLAVDKGGLSCHRAAAQFGIGVNTAILWVRRFRETGSVAPGQMGVGTSRRRFRVGTVIGCWSAPRQGTSRCAGLSPNSPSAG